MIASPMTSSPVFDVPSTVSQWMTAGTRLWTDFSMMPGETLVSTSFFRARSGRRAFRRPMSGLGGGLEVLEGLPGLAVVGREAGSLEGQTADELDLVLVGDLRLTLLGGVLGLGGLRGEAGDRLHERDRVEGEVERGLVGLALEVAVLDDTRVDRGLVSELRHCWVPVLCGCCREKTKT